MADRPGFESSNSLDGMTLVQRVGAQYGNMQTEAQRGARTLRPPASVMLAEPSQSIQNSSNFYYYFYYF
jgi:hypothetical protein